MMRALVGGLGDTLASPSQLAVIWLVLLLVALPAGVLIEESIHASIGASRVDESLRQGLDLGWLGEYRSRARGLEESVQPSIVGRGAVYDNLESWFSGGLFLDTSTVGIGAAYALIWLFLLGGVLDRCARRERKFVLAPFMAAGARFFPRLLRLTVISGVLYFGIYRFARWLFPWIERSLRDVTVERQVLSAHLAGALVVVALLGLVNLIFGYAKIAVVYEGRRSALGALMRAARFVAGQPGKTIGLYLTLALIGLFLIALYVLLAPGPGQSTGLGIALGFLVGQLYLVARLALRLTFFSAQMRLYESQRFGGAVRS
jgi:hypothetical protein